MKNREARFNAIEKTIRFGFLNEVFEIDLTEGDLGDSWNGITTKDNITYDFNFSWQEGCVPAMELYEVDQETFTTDHSKETTFKIVEQIGTFKDYFKEEAKDISPSPAYTLDDVCTGDHKADHINSRVMELADDIATQLLEKVWDGDGSIYEEAEDGEGFTLSEEAQDIFNIYYDEYVDILYDFANKVIEIDKK